MRDNDAKKRPARTSPQAGEANTSTELGETELKGVTGGIYFTMKMSKSSPG